MSSKKGKISVDTKDILPIIQKWLYSEHDIFLRELIANGIDAITKRGLMGRTKNIEVPEGRITVALDEKNKKIFITDNGIGMSSEEVEKYITNLAFSGAKDFVEKVKELGENAKEEIIGQFGLGFYSAYMVSDKVEIDSLSMKEGASAVHWISEGGEDYEISESQKKEVGTTITLHISEEGKDFLTIHKLRETLRNHCDFLPNPIEFVDLSAKAEEGKELEKEVINETQPLWKKDPSSLKDDDYKEFYKKMFPFDPDPLFWIHLNIDHPFTLQGILFFPKQNKYQPVKEHTIRLYCKQVFVSDNVKNVIPEFLGLLKGAIDSTDIPLNVSRSSLQGDPNIKKISNYIVKKVADELKKLFKNDRTRFEEIWEDIGLFCKYGCLTESKFDELMRDFIIYKNSHGKFVTLHEYKDSAPESYKEKLDNKVLYFNEKESDPALRSQLLSENIQTISTDEIIDPHFMQHVEFTKRGDKEYKFVSLDSEIENLLSSEETTKDDIEIKELFSSHLTSKDNDNFDVIVTNLKNSLTPAFLKIDESSKRMQQMTKSMGNLGTSFPLKKTLVVNPKNALIQNTFKLFKKNQNEKLVKDICLYVQDLATISSEGLSNDHKDIFVDRSQKILQELSDIASR